jgi:hypothetical protein
MSMPLDTYAANGDDKRNERSGPVYDLVRELMHLLDGAWSKDEERRVGVRLTYGVFAVDVEDQGYGVVSLTCVMPEPFLPAITSWLLFEDGAQAIAVEIVTGLIPRFLKVTDATQAHADTETQWEETTITGLRELGEMVRTAPQIDIERDPGLRVSALYRKATGDSLRIDAAPGGATTVTVHVRNDEDTKALAYAWHALPRPQGDQIP